MYHGWRYDGTGQCTDMPAEKRTRPDQVKIASYPVHEYAGLVFAYMGNAPAPAFDLPRKPFLEDPDYLVIAREEIWDCNWFQQIENSLDAVHVSFVHAPHWGLVSRFAEELTTAIPELAYEETSSGIKQIATRSKDNVRVSDWTFPNNNHVISPGPKKGDPWSHTAVWGTPIDDRRTMRFYLNAIPKTDPETDRRIAEDRFKDYNPADHYDLLFNEHRFPATGATQLITTQDYVVLRGQGEIVDRTKEWLAESDAGIIFLRRIFFREMEALQSGGPIKRWTRLSEAAPMPRPEPVEA